MWVLAPLNKLSAPKLAPFPSKKCVGSSEEKRYEKNFKIYQRSRDMTSEHLDMRSSFFALSYHAT